MRQILRLLTLSGAWIGSWSFVTLAQDVPPAVPSAEATNSPSSDSPPELRRENISRLLDQLRRQRQEVITDLRAKQETTAANGPGEAPQRQHRKLSQTRRAHADRDEELKSRERRVIQQMSRLEKLIRDQAKAEAAVPEPVQPKEEETKNQAENATSSDEKPTQPRELVVPEPPSDTIAENEPSPFSETQVDAISVTDQPVDRLALANNLYGTGEYKLALKVYAKIDLAAANEADQIWIRYQIANCQRQLKNSVEAQRGFRIVTSVARDSWWSQTSSWWLNTSDRLARQQDRHEKLQASLGQLRKEINEPDTP